MLIQVIDLFLSCLSNIGLLADACRFDPDNSAGFRIVSAKILDLFVNRRLVQFLPLLDVAIELLIQEDPNNFLASTLLYYSFLQVSSIIFSSFMSIRNFPTIPAAFGDSVHLLTLLLLLNLRCWSSMRPPTKI